MQINIATGDAVVRAIQNGNYEKVTVSLKEERKRQLERYIKTLKFVLEAHNLEEQAEVVFQQLIDELQEELRCIHE